MMISTVSILGIDDSISPIDLVDISEKYPFVEWGINIDDKNTPRQSFPSEQWLEELLKYKDKIRLRGVLHGRWEEDMLGGILSLRKENPQLWDALKRIQVDILGGYFNLIEALQLIPDKEIVLSTDGESSILSHHRLNTYFLLPRSMLFMYPRYCGYSIKDTDINLVLRKTPKPFWVNVEGFRSSDGITIDLFQVENVLDQAEEFVTSDSWIKALMQTGAAQKRLSCHP